MKFESHERVRRCDFASNSEKEDHWCEMRLYGDAISFAALSVLNFSLVFNLDSLSGVVSAVEWPFGRIIPAPHLQVTPE